MYALKLQMFLASYRHVATACRLWLQATRRSGPSDFIPLAAILKGSGAKVQPLALKFAMAKA